MRLCCCCMALWASEEVRGSTVLWGDLDICLASAQHTQPRAAQLTLAAWLGRRRAGLRRLRLRWALLSRAGAAVTAAALRQLAGSPLRELQLAGVESSRDCDTEAALAHLSSLPALAALSVQRCSLWRPPGALAALAGTLSALSLRGNSFLGRCDEAAWEPVAALCRLQTLDLGDCGGSLPAAEAQRGHANVL